MPLDIEHKIDDDPTSKGKHYAREINLVTDTLNAFISAYGDQDPTSNSDQLLAAIASFQADLVYKGMLQTGRNPNILTLKSVSSLNFKKYSQIGKALFYADRYNDGPVVIKVGNTGAKELKYNGASLPNGKLKPGVLYAVDLSGDEAILYTTQEPVDPRKVLTIITDFDRTQNVDNITGTGLYIYTTVHSSAHLPSSHQGHLLVVAQDPTFDTYQVYTDIVNGNIYARAFINGTWNDWRLTDRADFLYRDVGNVNTVKIYTPAITGYDGKTVLMFSPKYLNTGPTSIEVNSLGAVDLYYKNAPLSAKMLIPKELYIARYNGYTHRFDLYPLTMDYGLRDEFVGRTSSIYRDLNQAVADISDIKSVLSTHNEAIEANADAIVELKNSIQASINALHVRIDSLVKAIDKLTDKINNK